MERVGAAQGAGNEDEARQREERRLRTRVFDIYARSSWGGFLHVFAWVALISGTNLDERHPWSTSLVSLALLAVALARRLSRPPRLSASAQRNWTHRYIVTVLASTSIWSAIQVWVIFDAEIEPLVIATTLFATVVFTALIAHTYAGLLRLSIAGVSVLILPALVALWMVPELLPLAIGISLYLGYLCFAIIRSHLDYQHRLDIDEALRDQRDRYEQQSRTDALTGLHNRRHFSETLREEVRHHHGKAGYGVTLMLLDLDHFKSVNDRFGHVIGDEVLREFGRRVRAAFTEPDWLLARTGGEEFAIVLPDSDEASAVVLAEAFREDIEAQPITGAGMQIPITVSIGVGTFNATIHGNEDGLYAAVDVALYAAKERGRNRVVAASRARGRSPHAESNSASTGDMHKRRTDDA